MDFTTFASSLAFDLGDIDFWVVFGAIAVTSILAKMVARISRTHARERSRREIAAYIAEGSMTPEEGERLLKANAPQQHSCCS